MTDIYGPMPTGMTRATDFSAASYERQAVSLLDLIRDRMARGEKMIKGVTFTNCRVEGPAVVLVIGACRFDGTDVGNAAGDIRSLVLLPASPTAVVGAIPLQDCNFLGCQMVGIGYTGPENFLNQILMLGPAS